MDIRDFVRSDPSDMAAWRAIVDSAPNATLFHDPDFLAYHGQRFADLERHALLVEEGRVVGVVPAATTTLENGRRVWRSPYGASVGGPILSGRPTASRWLAVAAALTGYAIERQIDVMQLTLPPVHWSAAGDDALPFALRSSGFREDGEDLISTITLAGAERFGERTRRAVRRAESYGVVVTHDDDLAAIAEPLRATFAKHGRAPTHTLAELQDLQARLGRRIRAHTARLAGEPVAAIVEFAVSHDVLQAFYLLQDPARRDAQALSLLLATRIGRARSEQMREYDLGTSTEDGRVRDGVMTFKEGFGARAVRRLRLRWERSTRS